MVELILAIFLERTTKKDATNSSKLSSQTENDESALNYSGSNSKGKPENKAAAHNSRTVETMTLSKIELCDVCGEDLTGVPCVHVERRTKINIVFEQIVEHADAEIKQFPACDARGKVRFPADLHGPIAEFQLSQTTHMANRAYNPLIAIRIALEGITPAIGRR